MFPSPCALRSASCAALIALATAAGIVRVAEAAASAPAAPQTMATVIVAAVHQSRSIEPRTVRRPRLAATTPSSLPRRARKPISPPERFGIPRALSHRLPFAVGPPAPWTHLP